MTYAFPTLARKHGKHSNYCPVWRKNGLSRSSRADVSNNTDDFVISLSDDELGVACKRGRISHKFGQFIPVCEVHCVLIPGNGCDPVDGFMICDHEIANVDLIVHFEPGLPKVPSSQSLEPPANLGWLMISKFSWTADGDLRASLIDNLWGFAYKDDKLC